MPFDLQSAIKQLELINPKSKGLCMQVCAETAKVLVGGKNITPNSKIPAIFMTVEESIFNQLGDDLNIGKIYHDDPNKEFTDPNACYNAITNLDPGTVTILSTEDADHFLVLVKSEDNHLYLIDTDAAFYKEIHTRDDFKLKEEDKINLNEKSEIYQLLTAVKEYDYLAYTKPKYEHLKIFPVGKLNDDWIIEHTLKKDNQETPIPSTQNKKK